jgi:tetratricopeptide (TPR) repeat protein
MSRKKDTAIQLSAEENDQVQHLLSHYDQVAQRIYNSNNQAEAEEALADLQMLSEPAQIALLKSLAKEKETSAADILIAVNALSPNKEARKEARRGLIQLEGAKIQPRWHPPVTRTAAVEVQVPNPPRFWKGWATQTREEGEMRLVLCWEQGFDYTEARAFAFYLDFWQDGVKECVVNLDSKRHIDEALEGLRASFGDISIIECTPAEGKRLLEEALSVNAWRKAPPAAGYRNNAALIKQLLPEPKNEEAAPTSPKTFIHPELEPQEVAINFIGAWSLGDYGLAYDLLTQDSPYRERLERDEWIERRRAWADESHPARLELGFAREREQSQSGLWLPSTSGGRSLARKEVELGWSLELVETPLSGTLKEMPMGTAVNKDTTRHWFWTSYTLTHARDTWRIQSINDDGRRVQGLPVAELQKLIKENEDSVDAMINRRDDRDMQDVLNEAAWRLTVILHYYDALLVLLPFDYAVHEDAYQNSIIAANPERTQVYLERLLQRFSQNRVETLRRLASTLTTVAYKYGGEEETPEELRERQRHLLQSAENALQEALDADNSAINNILMAELLLNLDRNDEAETHLQQARTASPNTDEEAHIEAALGTLAMRRELINEAIPHYQRVSEIKPDYPSIWFNLGFAHRQLGNFEQADTYYQRAIEKAPTDLRPYAERVAIAINQGNKAQARAIAEQGVAANPDSAGLHALLASVLQEIGDRRAAQQHLAEAEAIDPNQPIVQTVRQQLQQAAKRR